MKHETEFRKFLMTEKRSVRTNQPFSCKVASDTVSRCKTVERLIAIELSGTTLGSDAATQRLCLQIKTERFFSTEMRPYAHNEPILAVRIYREFMVKIATWIK